MRRGTLVTDGDTKTLAHIKSNGPKEVAEVIEGGRENGSQGALGVRIVWARPLWK